MKTNGKVILGFILISLMSSGITIGLYSHLNKDEDNISKSVGFNQKGVHPAGYNVSAENSDFTLAAEQSINAVVHIKSTTKPVQKNNIQEYFNPFEYFFGGQIPQYKIQPKVVGFGSGVIISTDGYIVTNNHVIDEASEIEIITNNNETYRAKIIGKDESTDIALLKIEGKDFPVIPFGDSDALKIGEWVLAVGNPFNLTSTVTAGIVSAKGRGNIFSGYTYQQDIARSRDKIESFIQTDAAVNPGNSGGALVNTKGELVGINTAIYSETGNFIGYSFAIPINLVKKVIFDIKKYGVVQRALIGVKVEELSTLKEIDPETYSKLKVHEGVYVAEFTSNSSAKKAGMQKGDVITAINGTKVKDYHELRAELSRYNPGNIIEVQVYRNKDIKVCKVELKNDQGTTSIIKEKAVTEILGATFKELSPELKRKIGINYGVEISKVTNGKLKENGIREGFIILTANDTKLTSPETLIRIVESLLKQDPDERGLYIKGFYPNDRIRFYAIDMNVQ